MNKTYFNVLVKESSMNRFREIAKKRDVKYSQLFDEMLHAYLILNTKDERIEK